MTKMLSMRGEEVDFARYAALHENDIAIGNGSMNARGDLLGRGGVVVKRREAMAAEYHKANPKAVKTVSLKDIQAEVFPSPAEAWTKAVDDAKAGKLVAEPASAMLSEPVRVLKDIEQPTAAPARKRKLSDD